MLWSSTGCAPVPSMTRTCSSAMAGAAIAMNGCNPGVNTDCCATTTPTPSTTRWGRRFRLPFPNPQYILAIVLLTPEQEGLAVSPEKVFFTCALLPALALADQVTLKNGDIVTGAVVRKEGDKLTLKSDFFGEVNILWLAVTSI